MYSSPVHTAGAVFQTSNPHETGHGFGLHSGANSAKEMGGELRVFSDGVDKGATFVLEIPLHEQEAE